MAVFQAMQIVNIISGWFLGMFLIFFKLTGQNLVGARHVCHAILD